MMNSSTMSESIEHMVSEEIIFKPFFFNFPHCKSVETLTKLKSQFP